MPREIDEKKTRKALRRLARAKRIAEQADEPDRKLSEWEDEFLDSVGERLDKFGSAFNDLEKGGQDEALSALQAQKLREIEKKAKGKARSPMKRGNGFKRKQPSYKSRSRDINEDVIDAVPDIPAPDAPEPPEPSPPKPANAARPGLRVITGGKSASEDD